MKKTMQLEIEGPIFHQAARCEPMMRSLPDWFAIEEAIVRYINEINSLPTFIASQHAQAVGFLSVKQHNQYSAEIHVLAVLPEMHRQGIGRQLVVHAEDYLRSRNVEYLHLKTLSDSHPDEGYARTRAFYSAAGFRPLEELPTLWNEENPCLIMVKRL
ncbi:MAG: GNAT family N-acetyltransferase [Caldilineaceae bacterium]